MSLLNSLGLLALVASPAAAFWRLPCAAPLVVERADPIVNPGNLSAHVHQIMGGNGFDFSMDYQSTQDSTCTSCKVHGDMSNYWTPVLYFQHSDGSFEKVDQVGGGLVYYLQRPGPNNDKLLAFPEGFRMLAGDPMKRSGDSSFETQAISYACLNYNGPATAETNGFPTVNCPSGLRAQVFFPSCWDGKNLDSADHKSHMAYPIGAYNSGSCPSTHPVHLVSIFYEVIWDVNKFASQWSGSSQPFVWSNGDPTGYGYHGDFINGWKTDILQQAVDTCTNDSGQVEDCPVFQLYDDATANGCKLSSRVDEDTQGPFSALPGCNPITQGPEDATPVHGCGATTTIGQGKSFFKDLTSSGWGYQGCGTDNYYNRALTGASTSSDSMTLETCASFCSGKGFSIFGTEYGKECYCSNSIPTSAQPQAGVVGNCQMPCAGDSTEYCGGSALLSLYQKCSGSTCVNAAGVAGPSDDTVGSAGSAGSAVSSAAASVTVNAVQGVSYVTQTSSAATVTVTSKRSMIQQSMSSSTTTTTAYTTASPTDSSDSSSPSDSSDSFSADIAADLPSGWTYQACHLDVITPRTLPHLGPYTLNNTKVTSSSCVSYCDANGYAYAGSEYGGECWCGSSLPSTSSKLSEGSCNMPCKGDSSEICGGSAALSLYMKGSAGSSKRSSAFEMKGRRHEHLRRHVHKARRVSN